jgi:HEAT repeat protein
MSFGDFPAIRQQLHDKAPVIRATAASAQRFIEGEEVERELVQVLTSDPEPDVRLAAVKALGYRDMTERTLQASSKAGTSDKSVQVRQAALGLLWQCRHRFSSVVSVFENAAKNDPDEEVRATAAHYLGRGMGEAAVG